MDGLQSVGGFLCGLIVIILVIRESVTELLVVHPLVTETQVEHGECGISRHLEDISFIKIKISPRSIFLPADQH